MSKIGKVTLKSTGQEIKVIQASGGNPEFVDILQCALSVVREMDVKSVSVAIDCGHELYTDYGGSYNSLSAASNLLNSKITKSWIES